MLAVDKHLYSAIFQQNPQGPLNLFYSWRNTNSKNKLDALIIILKSVIRTYIHF